MIPPELLSMLCCPQSRQPLCMATSDELARVNREIAAGRQRTRGGTAVSDPLDAALRTEDATWLYPIRDGIPILLASEALGLVPDGADNS